jgi:hypothetical protein
MTHQVVPDTILGHKVFTVTEDTIDHGLDICDSGIVPEIVAGTNKLLDEEENNLEAGPSSGR